MARHRDRDESPAEELIRRGLEVTPHQLEELRLERMLRQRLRVKKGWSRHRNAYIGVNAGMLLLNLFVVIADGGRVPPFFMVPAALWGIGLIIHYLNHRSFLAENAEEIALAERTLLRAPAAAQLPVQTPQVAPAPAPVKAPVEETAATELDLEWKELLTRCKDAVERAEQAVARAGRPVSATAAVRDLQEGLAQLRQLALGARRLRLTVEDIAPEGLRGIDRDLAQLDERISRTTDEDMKELLQGNRALLQTRRAKVERVEGERARMWVTAEGFLMAADNVRLDLARLAAGETPSFEQMQRPVQRVSEEVALLKKVEGELARSVR